MRKAIYVCCLAAVLAILVYVWMDAHPLNQPDRYTSIHLAATMAPLKGFSVDSIVNTGDEKTLDALPGIGEVISQRIIEQREALNGYRLPEDLLLVKGIGEKTLISIMEALEEPLVNLQELTD